jgi:hypothetical protein
MTVWSVTLTVSKTLGLSGDNAVVFCGFVPAPSDTIEADLRGNGATRNPSSREVAAKSSRRAISRATSYRRSSAQSAAGTEAWVRTTQTVGQRVTPLAWMNAATAASCSPEDIRGGVMTGLAVPPIIGDILLEFVVRARRAPPLASGACRYSHRPRSPRKYRFACRFLLWARCCDHETHSIGYDFIFRIWYIRYQTASPHLMLRHTAALDALFERID